ncbi:hypothetical protein K439DRAFT_274277 [Ramaria rubella]|nr:hypothetical protein K439DRAFT_274277 [Ramaria rubella]
MTAPTQPVSSQPPQSKTISISGFKVSGLRKKRTHPGTLRPFVVLSVDAKSKHQTESKPCSDDVSWDDRFIFEIKETSTLEFKVLHSGFLGRELGTIVVHGKDIWMIESKPQGELGFKMKLDEGCPCMKHRVLSSPCNIWG